MNMSRKSSTFSDSDSDEFYEAMEVQEQEGSAMADDTDDDATDSRSDVVTNSGMEPASGTESASGMEPGSGMEWDGTDGVGALRQFGEQVLILTGKPLSIPITQVQRSPGGWQWWWLL